MDEAQNSFGCELPLHGELFLRKLCSETQQEYEDAKALLDAGIYLRFCDEQEEENANHAFMEQFVLDTMESAGLLSKPNVDSADETLGQPPVPTAPAKSPVLDITCERKGTSEPEKPTPDDGVNEYMKRLHVPSQQELADLRSDEPIDGATAQVVPVLPLRIMPSEDYGRPPIAW
jgi:hypothetical protein